MTYPKIFSLSTVGILKHYVHDYLFHRLRTDFIGSNGVGKSIIADLMQLMFVYDTSLIKFGTDGVKKDDRSIYTLPYDLVTAYCFLNIEVEKGEFLIIGIAISSQVGSRIVPFVITRSPELEKDGKALTLSIEQRLFARDFLNDSEVPDLKGLATKLLSEHNLYLNFFRTKEDTKRYYQFLYEKQILSINLSVEEHLGAFAKVIQSFSKAKSLDLSPAKASKSLKKFLFEEGDNDLEGEYLRQQGQLEKLLRDFSSLDSYVRQLRLKQEGLVTLKQLNDQQRELFKDIKIGEIMNVQLLIQEAKNTEADLTEKIEREKEKKRNLEEILADLPEKKNTLKNELDAFQGYTQLYKAYRLSVDETEKLQSDITMLKLLNPPILTDDWQQADLSRDFLEYSPSDIKKLITDALPYLAIFQSPSELELAFDRQKENMTQLHQTLIGKQSNLDKILGILENNKQDSVIGWGLKQRKNFNAAEQTLLFHFATRAIAPTPSPKVGDTYIDTSTLLQAIDSNANDTGFWMQLGSLKEYIQIQTDEGALFNAGDGKRTIVELSKKLVAEKTHIQQQFHALDAIYKGKDYDPTALLQSFDPFLVNYTNIEKIKEAAGCINRLSERIESLEKDLELIGNRIKDIRSTLPSEIIYDEPEVIERDLKRLADEALGRYTSCNREETIAEQDLRKTQDLIHSYTEELTHCVSKLLCQQSELASFRKTFFGLFQAYPEAFNSLQDKVLDSQQLTAQFQQVTQDYRVKYLELVGRFEETKTGKNAIVNREVNEKSFEFEALEAALLGLRIKHTDEIARELEEANRNRMNIADNIKNTMVRIFDRTNETYKQYKDLVYTLNQFFQGVKISDRFYFSINFIKNDTVRIDLLEEISAQVRNAAKRGELPFDKPVGEFIEEFFRKVAQLKEKVPIDKLLDPKTFFDLSLSLTDEKGQEIPGSTGETYSAIALLGIARLSIVQKEKRRGLRFIILEELGSLDTVNFNTFPAIAKEFHYQIITMAPTPFRSSLDDEWYAHHLIKGVEDKNVNYYPSASYFKTKAGSQELEEYLKQSEKE